MISERRMIHDSDLFEVNLELSLNISTMDLYACRYSIGFIDRRQGPFTRAISNEDPS